MAATQPPEGEPGSLEKAIFGDGFLGVVRAAWIKAAAVTQEGADAKLIQGDE